MAYAENTSVSIEKSQADIQSTLRRYGAEDFASGWSGDNAFVAFKLNDRLVKFVLPMPDINSDEFQKTEQGRDRKANAAYKAWEQAGRARWRALLLVIKAKLEAIEVGVAEFEQEFLGYIALPNGQTVYEATQDSIEQSYATGRTLELMP